MDWFCSSLNIVAEVGFVLEKTSTSDENMVSLKWPWFRLRSFADKRDRLCLCSQVVSVTHSSASVSGRPQAGSRHSDVSSTTSTGTRRSVSRSVLRTLIITDPVNEVETALTWNTSANNLYHVIITNVKCACFRLSTERSGLLLRVCVLQTGARQDAQERLLSEGTTKMIYPSPWTWSLMLIRDVRDLKWHLLFVRACRLLLAVQRSTPVKRFLSHPPES